MDLPNILCPLLLVLLLADPSLSWSQKTRPTPTAQLEASESKAEPQYAKGEADVKSVEEGKEESKVRSRYAGKKSYILDHEDDSEDDGKEYQELDEHEEEHGAEHQQGYHNVGKKVEDETTKDYHDKGGYSDFKEGGATFDKHHRDHTAENKENENIRAHDEGAKFGSEALKEHKLGKHREKSVGHKKHGFKNVYHKEEYGDHKTFHDEYLDNDHHHEYDDEYENRQTSGGKFEKGYQKKGENKEVGEGDEAHQWGKSGHDGYREGAYEKGGHLTGHHLGHQKDEGHHQADAHRGRVEGKRYRKGDAGLNKGAEHPHYYAPSGYQPHYGGEEDEVHEERTSNAGDAPRYAPAAPHRGRQQGGGFKGKTTGYRNGDGGVTQSQQHYPAVPHKKAVYTDQGSDFKGAFRNGGVGQQPVAPYRGDEGRHQVVVGLRQAPLQPYARVEGQPQYGDEVTGAPMDINVPLKQGLKPVVHYGAPHRQQWTRHQSLTPHYGHIPQLRSQPYPWWRHSKGAREEAPPPLFSQQLGPQDESQAAPSYSHLAHARAPVNFPRRYLG